jgi:hypothetical protein
MTGDTPEAPEPTLTAAEKAAKVALDNAVYDLQVAAQGTVLLPKLSFAVLALQLDALADLLAETGVLQREEFFRRITARVESMASECRRAVLASGGASQLAGIKKSGH